MFYGCNLIKILCCYNCICTAFSFQLGIIGKALSYWRGVLSRVVHIRHQASQNAKTNRPGLKTADTVYILINFKIISRRPPLERRRFPDGRPLAGPNPSFCWQQQPPTRERAIHPSLSENALVLGEGAIDPPLAEGAWVGVLFACCVCVCVGVWGVGCVCVCVLMWGRGGGVREEKTWSKQ